MNGSSRSNYILRIFLDSAILTAAFLIVAKYLSAKGKLLFPSNYDSILLLTSLCSWYFVAKVNHLYDDFRSRVFSYELISIVKTVIFHSIVTGFLFFYFFNNYPSLREFTLIYSILSFVLISIEKFLFKKIIVRLRRKGIGLKKILIVGAGEIGMNFYETITYNLHLGYKIIGFVDDSHKPQLNGQYLGAVSDLMQVLEDMEVQEIVIALPSSAVQKIEETIAIGEKYAKRVRIIPDYYRLSMGNMSMTNIGSFPMITMRASPLDDPANYLFKRLFDITFSFLFLLIFGIWLFPLIALCIKLTSKGPVFFNQERWGINGKRIMCYKFRSMFCGSNIIDDNGKFQATTKNDPRVTSVGKVLRKYNLDELPQFFNVLKGEMSVVGPRPHASLQNMEMMEVIQNYMLRHLVKPGITGWAQVNGHRGEAQHPIHMQERVNFDLWYIENWNFWLDWQVVFQTFINMIKGDINAY